MPIHGWTDLQREGRLHGDCYTATKRSGVRVFAMMWMKKPVTKGHIYMIRAYEMSRTRKPPETESGSVVVGLGWEDMGGES